MNVAPFKMEWLEQLAPLYHQERAKTLQVWQQHLPDQPCYRRAPPSYSLLQRLQQFVACLLAWLPNFK